LDTELIWAFRAGRPYWISNRVPRGKMAINIVLFVLIEASLALA
jgi:hypothetical protein